MGLLYLNMAEHWRAESRSSDWTIPSPVWHWSNGGVLESTEPIASGPRYQMIFADIDGVLVDGTTAPTPRTMAAIARVRALGIVLVLCTGRSRHAAARIADLLGGEGYGIVLNGALVLDWKTG